MAIALDRATEAMANRTDPTRRHLTEGKKKRLHLFTLACAAAVGLAVGLGHALGAASVWSRWTAQPWLLRHVQSVLDYVQNPGTFIFHITNPVGNFLVKYGLVPLRSFFVEMPWPAMTFGLALIAFLISRTAACGRDGRDAHDHRCLERVDAGDGHALAGARRDGADDARRHPARRVGCREPARAEGDATDPRRVADAAAARLHHPVHLPDAGVDRARHHRRRALRVARRHPARRRRRARGLATRGRGRRRVRRDTLADAPQGEDPARARRDHARREPGHDHGARRRRHRRARRLGRTRLRRRAGAPAELVRARRARVARDPRHSGSRSTGSRRAAVAGGTRNWRDTQRRQHEVAGRRGDRSRACRGGCDHRRTARPRRRASAAR